MNINDNITKDVKGLMNKNPYFAIVLNKYLPKIDEYLDNSEYEYELSVEIDINDNKPVMKWYPLVKIIVEKNIDDKERAKIASEIKQKLDQQFQELRETDYSDEILENWVKRISYAIGNEEDFND